MFSLKKLGVTIALSLGMILTLPTVSQARDWDAIEKATEEAKTKNYWTTDGSLDYLILKTYDMNKYTPDAMVKIVLDDAKTQDAFGKVIFPRFKIKASSESDAKKKIDAYFKKMKSAKTNKYGLGFGLSIDVPYSVKYNKTKKEATYYVSYTTYEMYAMQYLFDEALRETYLDVNYCSKDFTIGDKYFYRQKTRSVFKDANAVKKSSDSVKLQFLASYMAGSCRLFWGRDSNFYDRSLKAVINKEAYGDCDELADLWDIMANLISVEIESIHCVCWRETDDCSHEALLLRAKNKDGKWDYFTSNNSSCGIFGDGFLKEYEKGVNIYSEKGYGINYDHIEDWMHYDYKAYVTNKGEFGKGAYKYGKNHTKSELVNLMISKKAKYLK